MDELKKATDRGSVDTTPTDEVKPVDPTLTTSTDVSPVTVTLETTTVDTVLAPATNGLDHTPAEGAENSTEPAVADSAVAKSASPLKKYLAVALGVVVIGLALVYVMEQDGRLQTGVFSFIQDRAETGPVASVNGVEIERSDYDASVKQLQQMLQMQGGNPTDPIMQDQFKTQALDTLINSELLRQAAVAARQTAADDLVEARYSEIAAGVGGAEILAERMAEFGITEAALRRDIANEILIQNYFQAELGFGEIEVSEAEITEFYDAVAATRDDLPPLAEVRDEVVAQLRGDKEQALITELIAQLRTTAEIEQLI